MTQLQAKILEVEFLSQTSPYQILNILNFYNGKIMKRCTLYATLYLASHFFYAISTSGRMKLAGSLGSVVFLLTSFLRKKSGNKPFFHSDLAKRPVGCELLKIFNLISIEEKLASPNIAYQKL